MDKYSLTEGVHVAIAGEVTVFLDANADRYFVLTPMQNKWFQELCAASGSRPLDSSSRAFATRLIAKGLIKDGTGSAGPLSPSNLAAPVSSAMDRNCETNVSLGAREYLSFVRAMLICWRYHRFHSFSDTIAAARRWTSACRGQSPATETILQVARDFERIAPMFISTRDQCRFRSLLLLRFLADHGIGSNWVFGVRSSPFAAHCWIECGDTALNEHTDNLLQFQPILRV